MENPSDTQIGPYTIRPAMINRWELILTATGEHLRYYWTHASAVEGAERYERLTAALS
jgi:hypothetical protein